MKKKHYIAFIHPIREEVKTRIDFNSEIEETEVYKILKLDGYSIYQFILPDFQYVMSFEELRNMGIKFDLFKKEKSTWFGLSKKIQQELLIYPVNGFFYPYQYGSYLYLFSKEDIKGSEFIRWIDEQFPQQLADFDKIFTGVNSDLIKLLYESDCVLVTNHDYQKEFGVIASSDICVKLTARLKKARLDSFETEDYV